MADGSFPGLVSRNRDVNSVTNEIFSGITDGTDQLLITAAGEISVDAITTSVTPGTAAANLGKAVDDAGGATDTGVALLALRDDVLTTLTPVDGDYVRLRVDSTGALHTTSTSANASVIVDDSAFTPAVSSVTAVGFFADETAPDSVDEGDIGAARMTLDRRQLQVLTDADTEARRLNLAEEDIASAGSDTGIASMAVRDDILATLTPADGDYTFLRTDSLGALWVRPIEEGTSGTEIHDFTTTASLASDTTTNHDTTSAATTFLLKSVIFSGSGSVKAEIQAGPLATLVTVAVGFLTGRQGDVKQLFFDPPVEATGTTPTIRVILTNRQGSASDVYSTVIGNDI